MRNSRAVSHIVKYVISAPVREGFGQAYLDELVVSSTSPQDHIDLALFVLLLFEMARTTLKLKKCKFFAETIDNLGHLARPGRLELAGHSMDAFAKLENPSTET